MFLSKVERFNGSAYTKLGKHLVFVLLLVLQLVALLLRGPTSTTPYQPHNWAEICLGAINSNDTSHKVSNALASHPTYPFGSVAENKPPIPHFVTVCSAGSDHCLSYTAKEWCELLLALGEYTHHR